MTTKSHTHTYGRDKEEVEGIAVATLEATELWIIFLLNIFFWLVMALSYTWNPSYTRDREYSRSVG